MEHPQPAFDFLLSLPGETPPEENIFVDWYAHFGSEVEKGDDIRDYPEVWEVFELPDALAGLERDDAVAIQTFEGSLNLNAIAIGLGLENIKYEPELFPALVYEPDSANAVVFVWPYEVIVAIPKESGDASEAASGVEQLVDRAHKLGLTDDIQFDDAITTHRVASVIS